MTYKVTIVKRVLWKNGRPQLTGVPPDCVSNDSCLILAAMALRQSKPTRGILLVGDGRSGVRLVPASRAFPLKLSRGRIRAAARERKARRAGAAVRLSPAYCLIERPSVFTK